MNSVFSKAFRKYTLCRAIFVALFAVAALPQISRAQALALKSGDKVTIDHNGTIGTINGASYKSNATLYSTDSANDPVISINDPGYYFDFDLPLASLTLGNGGTIKVNGKDSIGIDNNGVVTITGGIINVGKMSTGLTNNIASASISGGTINASGDDSVGVSNISGALDYGDESYCPITITGGSIIASGDCSMALFNKHSITISGGTIIASGHHSVGLYNAGNVNLFSKDDTPFYFSDKYNSVPVAMNNTTFNYYEYSGTITGTLRDGSPFSTTFSNMAGLINLNPGVTPPKGKPSLNPVWHHMIGRRLVFWSNLWTRHHALNQFKRGKDAFANRPEAARQRRMLGYRMEDETLNIALDMALEWGPNILKPTQPRMKERFPYLSDAEANEYDQECRQIMKAAWPIAEQSYSGKIKSAEAAAQLGLKYPQLEDGNIRSLIVQGEYYAWRS